MVRDDTTKRIYIYDREEKRCMSIDELSNSQREEKRDLVTSNDTMGRNYPVYKSQDIATVSDQPGVRAPLSPQELKALHRVRVNRIIMRKRRQARISKDMVPRFMTTAVIVLAILTLLV